MAPKRRRDIVAEPKERPSRRDAQENVKKIRHSKRDTASSVSTRSSDEDAEVEEDQNLLFLGESDHSESSGEDVPVRYLTDFSLFDPNNENEYRTLFELDQDNDGEDLKGSYGRQVSFFARGTVRPKYEDGEEDELFGSEDSDPDEPGHRNGIKVRLSVVMRSWCEPDSREIWIQTPYAWYILVKPSKDYAPEYKKYWLLCRLVYLVVDAVRNDGSKKRPSISWSSFVKSLQCTKYCSDEVAEAELILGRSLIENDFLANREYIYRAILQFHEDSDFDFDESHEVFQKISANLRKIKPVKALRGASSRHRVRPRIIKATRRGNIENEVLKHRHQTYVTPQVATNAEYFFHQVLKAADQFDTSSDDEEPDVGDDLEPTFGLEKLHLDDNERQSATDPPPSRVVIRTPEDLRAQADKIEPKIRWIGKTFVSDDGLDRDRYDKMLMKGVRYEIGDFVMIPVGILLDEDVKRVEAFEQVGSQSSNTLANVNWFGL